MSKLYDIEKIYGQDFGIAVTNAPSKEVNKAHNLFKNVLLIASPEAGWENGAGNGQGKDEGTAALFATDYEGNPVQLTYPIKTGERGNGLVIDEDGSLTLKIDETTIKSKETLDDGTVLKGLPLFVDTTNLTFARLNDLNNRGVVNVADYIPISRELSDLNENDSKKSVSGISITNDGCLYISETFINRILQYVQLSIEDKIKPLAKENMNASVTLDDESLVLYTGVNPYQTESIGTKSENGYYNIKKMTLNFVSENDKPIEGISLPVVSGNMLIKIDGKDSGTSEVDTDKPYLVLGDYKQYNHTLKNIEAVIYPNYNIINNQFIPATNAFKIEGIKELDNTIREYPSVSFTQAAMESNSDTGFLFKIVNNVALNLNYTIESNVITVSMDGSININYRGLYSYTNQDKRYEPISYKYKIFIGPQQIYGGETGETLEPNKDLNTKSISIGYSDIIDQNLGALDVIKNSCVRDNTGQIQILGSSATYNKLYVILYIHLPGQEPYEYKSNNITVNHKNVGNYKNVVFKYTASSYMSGSTLSSSLETHALSLNSGNDEFVQYVINHISGGKVNLTLSFRYTGEQYNLEGKNDISSLLFTAQNGDETILFENSNTDQGQITGEGTIITLKSSNYFIDKNYIVKTTFSTDKPNFSTDSDFTFNLQEVILNRLNNAVKICSTSNNSGVYYTEGKQITNQYVYISKTLTYGSKTLTVNISGNNTGLEVSEENGYHKIKVTPEPQNIELLLQTDGSNFIITKELPVYKLGTISNIEFATEPISKGDNKYQINYTIIYSGTDTGGHIPETVTFSPNNVATLENINQRNANSGYINIQVNSNELCTLTFTVRGNNYINRSVDYNFGTVTEPVNTKILQSFTMSVNGITKDDGDDATINLTNGGILLINPTPSTTDELFNVTTKSEHLRITEDPNHENQYILSGIDETGTTDKAQVTVEPVKYNIASKTINIEVVESGGESGVQLNSISWTPNVGTDTITNNASNATIVGQISINPDTASSYNFEITFRRNGSIISSGITTTINNNREISVQSSLLYSAFGTGTSIDVIMTVTPTGYVASDIQGISKTITINKEASSGEVNDLTSFDFSNTDNLIEIERTKYKTLVLTLNPSNSTVSFDWTTESNDISLELQDDKGHKCKIIGNNVTSTPATITVTPIGTFEGVTAKTKQISVIPLNGGVKSIEWNSPVTSSGLSIVKNQTVTISVNKINCESSNLVWDYSPNNTISESIITMSNKTNSSCDITGNYLTITGSAIIIRCSLADDSSVYAELPIAVVSGDESNDPNELTVETGVATYARYFKSTDNGTTYTELSKINTNYILGVEKGTSVKLKAKLYTSNDEHILSHSINWNLTCENNDFILLGNLLNPCTVTASEHTGILSGTITVDYELTDTISVSSRDLIPFDPITPEPNNPEEPETLDLIPCVITSNGAICATKLSHDTNVLNDYTLSGNAFFSIKSNGYDLSKVNVDIPERTNLTVLPIDNYGYFCKRYYSYNYWPAGTSGLDTDLHDCTFNYNNDSEYLKLRYRAIYDENNTMFLDGNFYNYFARIPSCGVSNKSIHISLYPYTFDDEYFEFTPDNLEMYLLILDDNNIFNSYKFNNTTKIFVSQNSNNDIPLNETIFSSLNITISGLDIYINYSISQNVQTDYKNAILTIEGILVEFLQEYHNNNRIYFTNSVVNDYLYDSNDPNFNKFCQCGSKIITKDYTIETSSDNLITSSIYNSVMYPSVLENTFNITCENVTNIDTVLSWDNLEYKTCILLNSNSKIIFTKK